MGNFFDQYDPQEKPQNFFDQFDPAVTQPVAVPEVYSAEDLTQDVFFNDIQAYMQERFGLEDTADKSREEVVNQYLNNMRGFAGGNSVRAVGEISWINSLDQPRLETAGKAYSIFENMQSVFGDTSGKEKLGAVWDYTRTTLADPINLVSLGAGKLVTLGGTKAAAQTAQKMAMSVYQKSLAKGVTSEVALKAANEMYSKAFVRAGRQEAIKLASRRSVLQNVATGTAIKEIATTTAIDTFAAIGTDYAYQQGLIRTGVQEEYSHLQTGLAAFGGLVMGGVQLGTQAFRNRGRLALASTDISTPDATKVNSEVNRVVVETLDSWGEKVFEGKRLEDIPSDVFIEMLLGNDDKGVKGLAQVLLEEGFTWAKRTKDDKVSNWIADIIKQSDPQDIVSLMGRLRDDYGFVVPDNYTVKDFANIFAAKVNEQARGLNAVSQIARKLRVSPDDVTIGNVVEDMFAPARPLGWVEKKELAAEEYLGVVGKNVGKFQSNIIRLIVSNPATTALNLKGWGFATTMNSAVDIGLALVHGGTSAGKFLMGDVAGSKEALRIAGANLAAQKTKALNLLDPTMTYDAFRSYALARPEAMRAITEVLPGGVDDITKQLKNLGFDTDTNIVRGGMEKYTEFAGLMSGVQAQDIFTKSQEFVYQLDKKLRQEFDMGWSEFLTQPDAAKLMATERFAKAEAGAVYETQRAIFSKSYKGKGTIGEVAAIIEDFRKIPGVGLMVPFGRFFNNVVATMVDGTGLSLAGKIMGKQPERSVGDLTMRTVVGIGLISSLIDGEREARDAGLNWDESIGSNGEVISEKYDFPMSMYKATARLFSYYLDDMQVPSELLGQINEAVGGQLTRQMEEASTGFAQMLSGMLSGDDTGPHKDFIDYLMMPAAALISGATRPLDPVNQVLGLARGEDFSVMDRRQGKEWVNNSLRYMDQFVSIIGGEDVPERNFAERGKATADVGKFLGVRERVGYSSIEKLANLTGLPAYKLGSYTIAPEADNTYNKLFYLMVETRAQELVTSDKFINGNLETRRFLRDRLLSDVRESVMGAMERDVGQTGTDELATMLQIAKKGKRELGIAMRELGYDGNLSDLSERQLNVLLAFIENRKGFLERQ